MSDKAKMHQAAPRGNMPIRSYARAARATENTKQLERPNCLSIKGKIRLDRPKTLEIIKKLKFQKKIFGIAEMQGGIIDITCTSREAVLKLHEILEKQEEVQSVRLYQTDKIGIALGWVPIPMENGVIQEAMKEFGCVHKIIRKTDKDGMVTGMRIVIMNKQDIKDNPIPSYLIIQGYEVYVTYTGQEKTCRFCSETGHVRLDCPHWRDEFPVMSEARKKSAQSGPTSREVTPRDVTTPTHVASSSSLAAESLLPKYDEDILEANGNKKTTATSGNKRPLSSPEEVSHSKIKSISLSDNKISVWCKNCNKEGLVAEESTKYLCWGCKNEFNVIKTCCTQDEFFLVSSTDKSAVCPACREGMRLMPCCTTYQPTMQIADGTLQCPNCERYCADCNCGRFNYFLNKELSKPCENLKCKHRYIHCNCDKKYVTEISPEQPFKCKCGFEYDYNVKNGVKTT